MKSAGPILRALFGRVLSELGRSPSMPADILIEAGPRHPQPRLGVQFADGDIIWAALPGDDAALYQWHALSVLERPRRTLLNDARLIYLRTLCRRLEELNPGVRTGCTAQRPPAVRRTWPPRRPPPLPGRGVVDDEASKAAHERGIQLLRENLSPAQRRQYDEYGDFDVIGGQSGRRYRIRQGRRLNVAELDNKSGAIGWCFYPQGNLVAGDVMLAQKIALELYETESLKVAKRFSLNRLYGFRIGSD